MDNSTDRDNAVMIDSSTTNDVAIDPQKAMELFEQLKRQQNLLSN